MTGKMKYPLSFNHVNIAGLLIKMQRSVFISWPPSADPDFEVVSDWRGVQLPEPGLGSVGFPSAAFAASSSLKTECLPCANEIEN